MPVYPKADWMPVAGLESDPVIIPWGVVLHVDGGNASSLYSTFQANEQPGAPNHGVEATIFVNKSLRWEQYRDTTRQADAQFGGNGWVGSDGRFYGYNSMESQGVCGERWTPGMCEEISQFLAWHHTTHGTPLTLCRGPKDRGIGYHSQFPEWNLTNHACPCKERIAQIPAIITRAIAITNGADMLEQSDKDWLVAAMTWQREHQDQTTIRDLQAAVAALDAKVSALQAGGATVDLDAAANKTADVIAARMQA